MKLTIVALVLNAFGALAFPSLGSRGLRSLSKRDYAQGGCTTSSICEMNVPVTDAQAGIPAGQNAATEASAERTNCGIGGPCLTFDPADQYVSTTGEYAWQSPGPSDIRGPCPGLNAAANHGYIPRNGILTIEQTITGLGAAFSMAQELAAFLAVYSIALEGDVVNQQWSIGGPIPATVLEGVTGPPSGDGYSHGNYEGDTSIARCDAYINGGDAHSLSLRRFTYAYEAGMAEDSYNLDQFVRLYTKNTIRSVSSNPYYFANIFSGTVVAPAAYNFVINFMSNHSAEQPSGYLNGAMFKEFFAVTGTYPNFKWLPGQERIPDNWYKRPTVDAYDAAEVVAELIPGFVAYPESFRLGGNTNGVNSYTGVDIANLTGGTYNAATLFDGDNFACFFFEALQVALPTELAGGVNDVATALSLLEQYYPPSWKKLSCPQLAKYDSSLFTPYTGNAYKPAPPNSNYKANC